MLRFVLVLMTLFTGSSYGIGNQGIIIASRVLTTTDSLGKVHDEDRPLTEQECEEIAKKKNRVHAHLEVLKQSLEEAEIVFQKEVLNASVVSRTLQLCLAQEMDQEPLP